MICVRSRALSSVTLSAADQPLYNIVKGPALETIGDVIARMHAIDGLLAVNDGLKWFNRLYLMVTEQVDLNPPGGSWKSPIWLARLDVIFAGFYFEALSDFLWEPQCPRHGAHYLRHVIAKVLIASSSHSRG
jgi:uncharacterized protein DUF5995